MTTIDRTKWSAWDQAEHERTRWSYEGERYANAKAVSREAYGDKPVMKPTFWNGPDGPGGGDWFPSITALEEACKEEVVPLPPFVWGTSLVPFHIETWEHDYTTVVSLVDGALVEDAAVGASPAAQEGGA